MLSAALRVSCLLSLPNTVRRGILWNRPLQFRHRSVRLVADRLWSYGSATRGAAYNPYTGTAARGATVSTPYGSRSAAEAYNPYTGTYAQTRQGSSPTAQWGSSYVSRGNQSAYSQHYSTANGSVGWMRPRRAERRLLRALPGEIQPRPRPPTAICMPGTTGMSTRIQAPAGRLTTMAVGTRSTSQVQISHRPRSLPAQERKALTTVRLKPTRLLQVDMIDRPQRAPPRRKICSAKRKIGLEVDKRASASKISIAAGEIGEAAAGGAERGGELFYTKRG